MKCKSYSVVSNCILSSSVPLYLEYIYFQSSSMQDDTDIFPEQYLPMHPVPQADGEPVLGRAHGAAGHGIQMDMGFDDPRTLPDKPRSPP